MIPLALAHCLLQPGSKQGTNGGAFLSSENTSFPQKLRFDFQCNLGLHICTYSRAALFYVLSSGRSTASTALSPQNENVRFVQSRNVRFHGWPRAPWKRSAS